jgi:sterol desaturase/sphingolipid hydroxylase (fatty acid hydroxylase superfamily)
MNSKFALAAFTVLVAGLAFVLLTGSPEAIAPDIQGRISRGFLFMVSASSLFLVAAFFTLEYLRPARPSERGFSPSILFDAFYLFLQLPVVAVLILLISGPIQRFLEAHASGLTLDIGRDLPIPVVLLLGAAITDLTLWFSHVVRHKVPFLWRFHMIHHSQTRLSLFTASRDHPLDTFFETLIRVVPLFFLFPSVVENAEALAIYGLAVSWHIRLTHTNIATNLGALRLILVTPQSHRIHHSTEPEHWNSNYANIFCWDRLFGMQHEDDTSYPPTGVNDVAFPEPQRLSLTEFGRCYVSQLWFPFDTAAVHRATYGSPHELPAAEFDDHHSSERQE